MVRLVLFDIDGTLIQTDGAGVNAFARAMSTEFGIRSGSERLKFAGRTDIGLVREFFNLNQIDPSAKNFCRFFDCYVFYLEHNLRQTKGRICPGVLKFLGELKKLPAPPVVGLLTGNIRLGAEIKLRRFNLWEAFQTGAFADDHEERDSIAAVAKERGSRLLGKKLRGKEILVIGDTLLDIRCGRAIGAKVLAVATGGSKLEELEHHKPDWAMADLREAVAKKICS